MPPARSSPEERPPKRHRPAPTLPDDPHLELDTVQRAHRTGDPLSSPAVSNALDNLIASHRPSDSLCNHLEASLKLVKSSLDQLAATQDIHSCSALTPSTLRKILPDDVTLHSLFRTDHFKDLSITCSPPERVNVVGSFLLGYSTSRFVDVAVEMPSAIFHPKDYLNFRYHDKRLVYLIYLALHFADTEKPKWSSVSLATSYLNNDKTKPLICLTHVDHPKATVRLIPTYKHGLFEEKRLAHSRCNIRIPGASSLVRDPNHATVAYNASIAMDCTLVPSLQLLHAASRDIPHFADTVVLLNAWSRRYRLTMGSFVMATVLVHLATEGIVPPRASREHMVRCAFRSIAGGALKTVRLGDSNVCAGVDPGLLRRCEESAADALIVIESKLAAEDPWFGVLPYLFVSARGSKCVPKPLPVLFDGFIRVSGRGKVGSVTDNDVLTVLTKTLVDIGRVTRVEKIESDLFGIMIKAEEDLHRKVDTRPKEWDAASFKTFWGDKAGLRRFKDGRIVEALVWSGGPGTLDEMTTLTCQRHLGEGVVAKVIITDLEVAAGCESVDKTSSRAIAAFDELASVLRSLEGLPLNIRAVHATSAHLRRCGAFSIRPDAGIRFIHPLDIVASFESSGAWPDDPVAISAAKAGFYVALKTTLASKGLHSRATISFLDISLGGFVFRLRISVVKEKRILGSGSEYADALVWETEARVEHQDKIKYVGNALIGRVARLAKRWLNSHLLLARMGTRGEELVEALVAAVMSHPSISSSRSVMGYFCQFLHVLAEFPWEVCPLAVFLEDPDRGPQDESHEDERTRFFDSVQAQHSAGTDRKAFFAVYHAWNRDGNEAKTWFSGKFNPESVIAKRIVATARSSITFIETHLTNPEAAPSLHSIFLTPTNSFDVVLDLHEHLSPFAKGRGPFRGRGDPFVGLDPISKLRDELEHRLGQFALFLIEKAGRAQIFVVWRPSAKAVVKFALREAPFRTPEKGNLVGCREEMVEEMRRIGDGFIAAVRFPEL
eukprot:GFKZ01012837.1.p1 GENE.GFKZ01012837.1~~GFKZ01012837.1.p1  ORF type:complete len:1006 (+),score=135.83 GFKZ01012837.1:352-3369(+)